jgi:hypothetical protein
LCDVALSRSSWVVLVRTLKYLPCQLKLPSGHLCNKCWVHFDNEVHLGKMHQKVHLAKMHRLYVGIRKNQWTKSRRTKKCISPRCTFFPFRTSIRIL